MKKTMKKIIASIFAGFFLTAASFAFEWGGVVKNETSVSVADTSNMGSISSYTLSQSDGLYMWLNSNLTADSSWYLSTEALYKYKYNTADHAFTNVVDIDLLKITGQSAIGKGMFNTALGRYFVIDNSGVIFAQTCDGVSLKFSMPSFDIALYGGYTGLLNALNVYTLGETAISAVEHPSNQFYSLSYGYVPVLATLELPTFLNNQTLAVQASAFIDLGKEKYNRGYLNLMMKGPVAGAIFYTVSSTFGVANFDFKNTFSNLTNASFSIFAGNIVAFNIGTTYASGKHGIFNSFRGFTSSTAYFSKSQPELSGVLIPDFDVLFAFGAASIDLSGKIVFGMPNANIDFNGIEFGLDTVVNIFSDLQLNLNLKGYYDIAGNNADSYYMATVNLAFAF